MRKGMTLVELLVVLLVLPFAVMALDVLLGTMLKDFPRSLQLVQENATLLNMLEHVRKDVRVAKALPKSFGQYTADDEVLLIELVDGVVCYRSEAGKLIRRNLSQDPDAEAGDSIVWSLPNSVVQWHVWQEAGQGDAVEVKTHIRYKLRSKYQQKMANSHLYFLGAS